jgi:hypothetical protein
MPGTSPSPGRPRRLGGLTFICLLTVLLLPAVEALADEYLANVGTYTGRGSEGICTYRFDPATGATSALGLAAATDNPSFLAADPNGRVLYAVNELDGFGGEPTGAVSVLAIDRRSGRLELPQQERILSPSVPKRSSLIPSAVGATDHNITTPQHWSAFELVV